MKIYRVEHKQSRKGIYDFYPFGSCPVEDAGLRHPMPTNDSKLVEEFELIGGYNRWDMRSMNWRYGFESPVQMLNWIYQDNWLNRLHEDGFVLSVYEVPKVYYGNTQAIFEGVYHNADRRVEELPLTNFLSKPVA